MICTREQMTSALISLGYKVNKSWFTNFRGEKTASVKINTDGSYHDFGTGEHGDLIEVLLKYKNYKNFPEANTEAHRLLGLELKIDFTEFDKTSGEVIDSALPDDFMIPHRIDAKNYKQEYLAELKKLFLGKYKGVDILAANWEDVLKTAKKYDIGYNHKSKRLIMPIRDTDSKIKTFWKYRKSGEPFVKDGKTYPHRKVLYTKGRIRPPFAIQDLIEFRKTPEESIIICEGEKDSLIANANGLRSICIGGAGASKTIDEKYLILFKDLNIIIAGDDDKAGCIFNNNLKEQLNSIAKSVVTLNWRKKSKKDGFYLHTKFDIADYFAWKNK